MARSTRLKEIKTDLKQCFAKSFGGPREKWHLISKEWLSKLDSILDTNTDNVKLGPIDNSPLFENESQNLKSGLLEEWNYKIINENDWGKFKNEFGIIENHDIVREVVDVNKNKIGEKQNLILDLYPTNVKLVKVPVSPQHLIKKKYEKSNLIGDVEHDIKESFPESSETKMRLWKTSDINDINAYSPLADMSQTVFEANLTDQYVVMECNNKLTNGKWVLTDKHPLSHQYIAQFKAYEASDDSESDDDNSASMHNSTFNNSNSFNNSQEAVPGLSGCTNLGNTCFMNSAIQCLSNVPPLTEYFVSKKFLQDINLTNPLGMKGMIAKAYSRLMDSIWSNKNCTSQLRAFKDIVSDFAPTFTGYQQHDSQELLIFLLDGLHEDLNRVKKKPYVELKEAEGRKDEDVSKEAWKHFKLRNDSIIIDTFYGQLKSTLVCPVCSKVSVTFDPFSTLSVPLPYKKERTIKVKIVPYDPDKKPVQCRLNVPKNGTIGDLCAVINNLTQIPMNQILVSRITLNRFHKVFNSNESLAFISANDDIVIYEVPIIPDKGMICLPFYQQVDKTYLEPSHNNSNSNTNNASNNSKTDSSFQGSSTTQIHPANFFVLPFIVVAPANKTNERNIRKLLMDKMRRYVNVPDPGDEWWVLKAKIPNLPSMSEYSLSNPPPMFTIKVGNIYGNVDFTLVEPDQLSRLNKNQEMDINLNARENETDPSFISTATKLLNNKKYGTKVEPSSFLILDWNPIAKAKFFDIESALDTVVHDNVLTATNYLNSSSPSSSSSNNKDNTTTISPGLDAMDSENSKNINNISSPSNLTLLSKRHHCELTDCLDSFVSIERLSEEDSWYCPTCKKHQQATKKFDLWKLPPILIIHLKRFYYNRFFREKINLLVNFPIRNFDLSNYLKNPEEKEKSVYNLIAVSNHYGELGYGHYTAFAKNYFNKQWYNFDDTHVLGIRETDVMSQAGYVLVYQREGTENLFFSPSSISSSTYSTFESIFSRYNGGRGGNNNSSSHSQNYSTSPSNHDSNSTENNCSTGMVTRSAFTNSFKQNNIGAQGGGGGGEFQNLDAIYERKGLGNNDISDPTYVDGVIDVIDDDDDNEFMNDLSGTELELDDDGEGPYPPGMFLKKHSPSNILPVVTDPMPKKLIKHKTLNVGCCGDEISTKQDKVQSNPPLLLNGDDTREL